MSKLSEEIEQLLEKLKILVFGENNYRLEIVVEYFYRLNHERRNQLILYGIIGSAGVFILVALFYFYGLFSLQKRLNNSYLNNNLLANLKSSYSAVQENFLELSNNLKNVNKNLSLKNVITQHAEGMGLHASGFSDKSIKVKFPVQSPFADNFEKSTVEFKVASVSLRKTIQFITSLENLPNKFKVTKLEIISVTDAKLYFDLSMTVEAITPIEKPT